MTQEYTYKCCNCGCTNTDKQVIRRWEEDEKDLSNTCLITHTRCTECGREELEQIPVLDEKTPPLLIGLGYKKRSGKDTVADILVKKYGFVKVSLAYPLKELCRFLEEAFITKGFSGSVETLRKWYELKRTDQPEDSVDKVVSLFLEGINLDSFEEEDGKLRKLLQFVGTDVFRKVDEDFWVKTLFSHDLPKRVVVSDVRFQNELDAIETRGGVSVKVSRDTGIVDTHPSETALDGAEWKYTIDNNGTLEDLEEKVCTLIKELESSSDGSV